jgi:hypothetical protein
MENQISMFIELFNSQQQPIEILARAIALAKDSGIALSPGEGEFLGTGVSRDLSREFGDVFQHVAWGDGEVEYGHKTMVLWPSSGLAISVTREFGWSVGYVCPVWGTFEQLTPWMPLKAPIDRTLIGFCHSSTWVHNGTSNEIPVFALLQPTE